MRKVLLLIIMVLVGGLGASPTMAGDKINIPGVKIGEDGSVSAPGVKVDKDGNVSLPGVKVDSGGSTVDRNSASKTGAKHFFVNDDHQTIQLDCNNKSVVVNGDNNTIKCKGNSPLLNINGAGNKIEVNGQCRKLNLNGEDNIIKIELIGSIQANGDNNQVIWSSALKGKKPVIVSVGSNNKISKGQFK